MLAAYLRVSSRGQDAKMQRDAICRAAHQRGEQVTAWYSEKASGVKARPELDRLRKDARGGRVSKVYVYRLDRFSRGGIVETVTIVKEFKAAGVNLVSIADGFDLDGPANEIIVACLSWAAELERNAINERIAAARNSSETWGRPAAVDELTVRRIRQMATRCAPFNEPALSIREIAETLSLKKSTVANVLAKKGAYKRKLASTKSNGIVRVKMQLQ